MHQVEDFESALITSWLLQKDKFAECFLKLSLKQVNAIVIFGLAKNKNLLNILKQIETTLQDNNQTDKTSIESILPELRDQLKNSVTGNAQKKYAELDKYATSTLRKKYNDLFQEISNLLDDNALGRKFLQTGLAKELADNYYLPNLSKSVDRIRQMNLERKEIKVKLIKLNLADIFIMPNVINKINDLDFKKVALDQKIKSISDFIEALIDKLVSICTPSQLKVLSSPLLDKDKLNPLQIYLRDKIIKEIDYRTSSITKMVFSLVSGDKKEYDYLTALKKDISQKIQDKEGS
jgi:hypothetical protein